MAQHGAGGQEMLRGLCADPRLRLVPDCLPACLPACLCVLQVRLQETASPFLGVKETSYCQLRTQVWSVHPAVVRT